MIESREEELERLRRDARDLNELLLSCRWPLSHMLELGREIWGPDKLSLEGIVVRLGVDLGKLARIARGADKDRQMLSADELGTAMGNIVFSMVRWCDDLGLDPVRCVELAVERQQKFAKENKNR